MKTINFFLIAIVAFLNLPEISAQDKEESTAKFVDMWIENENQEKITSRTHDDKIIYVVMETINRLGEKASLTMDEEDGDFIYKQKYLSVGYELKVKVKSDIHKIKLEVFDPTNKKHQKIKRKTERRRNRRK